MRVFAQPRAARRLLLLAALLLAADTLLWLGLQQRLGRHLARIEQDAAAAGWSIEAAPLHRGGWPLAATLDVPTLRLHGGDAVLKGGVTWSGARIALLLSPLHPRALTIELRGPQIVAIGNAALADSLRVAGAPLMLHLRPLGDHTLRFEAGPLRLAVPGLNANPLRLAALDGTLRWTGQAAALQGTARRLDMHGTVVPLAALDASLAVSPARRLLLREARLRWPDCELGLAGSIDLTPNFPPRGAFSLRIVGADALLDRMVASGLLTEAKAASMRAVLGLIEAARDRAPDDSGSVTLPLMLHDGAVWLGQIPLLRLPLAGSLP